MLIDPEKRLQLQVRHADLQYHNHNCFIGPEVLGWLLPMDIIML